jgi:hypothetical protein
MADVFITRRRQSNLPALLAQPLQAQQAVYQQLIPLIFKSRLERMNQRQQMEDFADLAARSGNGPLGDYKWSWNPNTGFSYEQKSATEKTAERKAQEEMGFKGDIPRFIKYALHEKEAQPSDVSQIRLGQLMGKLIGRYPSERESIKDIFGGISPKESDVAKQRRLTRQSLSTSIGRLEELFKDIPSSEGLAGRFVGLSEWVKGILGYNPNLTTYNDFKDVILGQIAITIGGETGSRLSDQDIGRMKKAFPNEWKTTSEREKKWSIFKQTANDIAVSYGAKPVFIRDISSMSDDELRKIAGLK